MVCVGSLKLAISAWTGAIEVVKACLLLHIWRLLILKCQDTILFIIVLFLMVITVVMVIVGLKILVSNCI